MIPSFVSRDTQTRCRRLGGGFCAVLLLLAAGCPQVPEDSTGNGNSNTNGSTSDGSITATIINVSGFIQISELEEPLSVLYNVSAPDGASVESFYVRVGEETRFPISGSLPLGDGQFGFDPIQASVGTYQVGLQVTSATDQLTVISTGLIQVQGSPAPVFFQPAGDVTRAVGDEVAVTFDARDPEDDVKWRVFYLADSDSRTAPADELGTELTPPGEGNVGSRILTTAGLAPGNYEIGISAVDGGDSISSAVAKGDDDRIVTVFGPIVRILQPFDTSLPVISVVSPGASSETLFRDEGFDIEVDAGVIPTTHCVGKARPGRCPRRAQVC